MQLYFADDLTHRLHAREPYASNAATFRIAMRPGESRDLRFGPGRRRT